VTSSPSTCPTYTTPTPLAAGGGAPLKIEKGRVECENSWDWGTDHPDTWAESMTVTKKFNNAYSSPPTVHISVVSLDHDQGESIRYDSYVTQVTNTQFQVKCKTWAGSRIYHMYLEYVVIGN